MHACQAVGVLQYGITGSCVHASGNTGRGVRRALAPKQLVKPDMGTASLRQIVEYAAANDRLKVAEERRRLVIIPHASLHVPF